MDQTQSIKDLVLAVQNNNILLPEFQRDFVWEVNKTYDLFDSIINNIFIGSIIYGIPSFEITIREIDLRPRKTKNKKRSQLEIKSITKQEIENRVQLNKDNFRLILDGQQRTTSIYRAIKGIDEVWFICKSAEELMDINPTKSFKEFSLEELLYNIDGEQDDKRLSIKLSDAWVMLDGDLREKEIQEKYFMSLEYVKYSNGYGIINLDIEFSNYMILRNKIQDMFKAEKLLSYYLLDMTLNKFILFFERSNSKGVILNFIDILSAKLYIGFNLKQKTKEFNNLHPDYKLNEELIVRAIAYLVSDEKTGHTGIGLEIHRNFILTDLNSEHFNLYWDEIVGLFVKTLNFLYDNSFILSQSWIPYDNMIIPLMIFLKEVGGSFDRMNENQKDFIKYWYWASIFSLRYTGSSNERIILDSRILTSIAKNEDIINKSYFTKLSKSQISEPEDLFTYNKKNNAIYKGVLNLINFHSKGLIDWRNTTKLTFNTELEDHHIFPQNYIEKNYNDDDLATDRIDCVANRTLIPQTLNQEISNSKPSQYFNKIYNENPNLLESFKSHLIPKEILDGSLDNEFNFFLELRSNEIFDIINENIIKRKEEIITKYAVELKSENIAVVPVFARFYSKEVQAQFNPVTGTIMYNKRLYDSPSGAAVQAKIDLGAHEKSTANGWNFWKYIDSIDNVEKFITELRKHD
jgi:hypothetical protein